MQQKIQEIKSGLRLMMNGVTSTAMRERGLDYKLNFGVDIPRLRQLAKKYAPDQALAVALWKENARELKILASLISPPESFTQAEEWIKDIHQLELAEQVSMNLFSKMPDARLYAFGWIQEEEAFVRLCGFLVLTRLMMNGQVFSQDENHQLLASAADAFYTGPVWMQTAVVNTLFRLMQQGDEQKEMLFACLSEKKEMIEMLN